ncbi:SRPBCC family protein [Dinghuibacter silviterrae]|uniref:Polyketide cyclase/dehydrase/lipid transport protein n=1 Tax=Dinghuibacter silviterrae TaxID=1539049 RepID=A0A4V6Q9Z6_9BACT|nr:hypothetical protein [Dinghuibacter silviterrae]TDX00753.1 hypothetical protein EDB95_1781 [Dinghuibacter silviterrae]
MQKIKSVIIGISILLAFLCLLTAFFPRHILVTRSIVIGVRKDSIQALLEDFHRWPSWCTWMGTDSAVNRVYTPATDTHQATVTWYPKGHPENKMFISILQSEPGNIRLFYQFRNLLPAGGGFDLFEKKDSTILQWSLEVRLRWYPWEKISGVAMDKVWGTSMNESLGRLKHEVYGEAVAPDDDQDAR